MSKALQEFLYAARDEVYAALRRPWLFISGVAAPLFWWLILAAVFAAGLMRALPVGLVDLDDSAESRELVQTLSAIPSIGFEDFESRAAAQKSLASGEIYALMVIPRDWSAHAAAARSDSAIELFFNKSFYAIAVTIESDLKSALLQINVEKLLKSGAAAGGGLDGSRQRLLTVSQDVLVAGNPAMNFEGYLTATLVPGVMALAAILTGVGVVSRDMRRRTVARLVSSSRSVRAAMLGRLFPWWCLYLVYALGYVSWFAGFQGWAPEGSLAAWCAGAMLLMSAMLAMALCFVVLAPSWILAMSAAICYIAPTFPFTGFSFPLDSMDASAQALSSIFPLTWFLRLQSSQWVLASDAAHTLYLLGVLAAFCIVPLALGLALLPWRAARLARREQMPEPVDMRRPKSTLSTAAAVLLKGAFSRDTFAIFVLATAFYLVFYAWPYANQSITAIDTAVVDLDRSSASRSLIEKLQSATTLRIRAVEADPAQAHLLYGREAVSAVITVPAGYEESLLAGRPTAVRVTANGAFPVKSRAVTAAVMTVVSGEMMQSAARNLLRAGVPLETLARVKTAPVSMVDENLFNVLSGYAGYIVPVVMPVIIQAVLLMSIVMSLGGWIAERPMGGLARALLDGRGGFAALYGAFWFFGMMWIAYAMGIDFALFDFSSMQNPAASLMLMALFIAAIVSMGLAATFALNSNAYGAQLLVVISAPAVFLSGAVFPVSGFAWPALVVRALLPSTPGINGLVAAAQNGADTALVFPEALHLAILAAGYGVLAYRLHQLRARQARALSTTLV